MTILLIACCTNGFGQTTALYKQEIAKHRQHYKEEFLAEERSPLKGKDTAFIRFFPINEKYKVRAKLTLTPDAEPFDMPTANGKSKKYRQYGVLMFNINDTAVTLQVLQSMKLLEDPKHKDHLFVPFTDGTSYTETYGGGRYLDLSLNDIKGDYIEVDFNKCYNPWCAFGGSYSCPIPPKENRMPVSIRAGEKIFGKEIKH